MGRTPTSYPSGVPPPQVRQNCLLCVETIVCLQKKQASGHWYFSLKDDGAQIQCCMFGARKRPGAEVMDDGVKVRVFAEPSVYEARGTIEMIAAVFESQRTGCMASMPLKNRQNPLTMLSAS